MSYQITSWTDRITPMPAALNESVDRPIFFVCERIMAQICIYSRIVRVNRKLALPRKAKPRVGRLTVVKIFASKLGKKLKIYCNGDVSNEN